jgi:hypothetical protein
MRAITLILFCLLLAVGEADAQSDSDTSNEIWPEVQVFFDVKPKVRIFLLGTVSTSVEDGEVLRGQAYEALFGAHLDYLPNDNFFLRTGYRFITSLDESAPSKEHRIVIEQHFRKMLKGDVLLSDRNREDYRFINGDFSFRYRNRVTLEREFIIKDRALTPYASGEIFYDSRFNTWNRNRYAFGVVLPIRRRYAALKMLFPKRDVTVDIYYMRQNDSRSSTPHVNALGLAFQIHF